MEQHPIEDSPLWISRAVDFGHSRDRNPIPEPKGVEIP